GLLPSVHLLDHTSIHALNAALVGGRALLLRGQPGVGKSQLARAAADLLDGMQGDRNPRLCRLAGLPEGSVARQLGEGLRQQLWS
ncbi:MAG: ATP-binding protein, partial [Myxococcales bacterium]|nr:ATP-binding protein [Myxococcales bacterium]